MKLKQIEFAFENCESITIDGKYIGDFEVSNIKTSIERLASNSINELQIANKFAIEIHKDADKEYHPFGMTDCNSTVFERINAYHDITHIYFDLYSENDNGQESETKHYQYCLIWGGDSDYNNDYQSNYLSKDGNLYIVVDSEKKIEDLFDIECIDNANEMDFKFSMYEIGDKYSEQNYMEEK